MISKADFLEPLSELQAAIGQRAKTTRLARNLTQQELAERSAVGTATIKRFERSGHVSLENALRIAVALNAEDGFRRLFEPQKYKSIDDVLEDRTPRAPRRARRRS